MCSVTTSGGPGVPFDPRPVALYAFDLDRRGGVAMSRDRYTETGRIAFDIHFELEIGVVIRGALERCTDAYRTRLGPGSVWLHPPWEVHGMRVMEAPCEVIDVVLDPISLLDDASENWTAPFFAPAHRRVPVVGPPDPLSEIATAAMKRLADEWSSGSESDDRWVRHHVREVLLCALDRLRPESAVDASESVQEFRRIRPAMRILADRSGEPTLLESVAAACAMSRQSFRRAFKRATGLTFSQFQSRIRLRAAIHALRAHRLPIKAIAEELGFTDASHLTHWFKRLTGLTPAAFRNSRPDDS